MEQPYDNTSARAVAVRRVRAAGLFTFAAAWAAAGGLLICIASARSHRSASVAQPVADSGVALPPKLGSPSAVGALDKDITLHCNSVPVDQFCKRFSDAARLPVIANVPADVRVSVAWEDTPIKKALAELGARYETIWRVASEGWVGLFFNPPRGSAERKLFDCVSVRQRGAPGDDLMNWALELLNSLSDDQLAAIVKAGVGSGLPIALMSKQELDLLSKMDLPIHALPEVTAQRARRLVFTLRVLPVISIRSADVLYRLDLPSGELYQLPVGLSLAIPRGAKTTLADSAAKVVMRKSSSMSLTEAAALVAKAIGKEVIVDRRVAKLSVFVSPGEFNAGEFLQSLADAWFLYVRQVEDITLLALPRTEESGPFVRAFSAQVGRLGAAGAPIMDTPFGFDVLTPPSPIPCRSELRLLSQEQRKFICDWLSPVLGDKTLPDDATVRIVPAVELRLYTMKEDMRSPEAVDIFEIRVIL